MTIEQDPPTDDGCWTTFAARVAAAVTAYKTGGTLTKLLADVAQAGAEFEQCRNPIVAGAD